VRPHGLRRGCHQGSEGHWEARRALSSRLFCPCDSRRVSLWYLSAGLRYTTHRRAARLVALVAAVVSLHQQWARMAVRVAGSWMAAMGLLRLGWFLHGGNGRVGLYLSLNISEFVVL
jgi:hypothetical protein